MEFLIGVFAMIGSFLAGVFGHVLAHDFCEFTPRMCRRLIERAANLLPEGDRARYTEEWLSHLSECPGVLAKFQHACTCVLGARSLRRVIVQKPLFRTLRIEFDEIGFVELDFPTSMVLASFISTYTTGLTKKRSPGSRASSKLAALLLIKNFAAACVRNRKLGPIDTKKIEPLFNLVTKAIKTRNTNLRIYRDGSQLDLSALQKDLNELKSKLPT